MNENNVPSPTGQSIGGLNTLKEPVKRYKYINIREVKNGFVLSIDKGDYIHTEYIALSMEAALDTIREELK